MHLTMAMVHRNLTTVILAGDLCLRFFLKKTCRKKKVRTLKKVELTVLSCFCPMESMF